MTLEQLANLNDADDEEIDEESAFNSDDEKTFGKYLSSSPKSVHIRSKNLSLPIPFSQHDDTTVRIVEIAKGSKMTLSSVCLDVSQCDFHQVKLMYRCIYPNPDASQGIDDFSCLCNYLSVKKGGMGLMPVTPVNLEAIGPCKMEFRAEILAPKKIAGGGINVFGVIVPVDHFVGDDVPAFQYADASEEEDESVAESVSNSDSVENGDGKSNGASLSKQPATKKRKLEEEVEEKPSTKQPASANLDETSDKKLTKKQRKKLAQEKAKQLEETLSAARNDTNESTTNNMPLEQKNSNKKKKDANQSLSKTTALTRERRLAGGLVISDILLGAGAPVKPGKRISLHYTGSLRSTGRVFDKNNSKQHPLVFRQGTGEVIRGLERGLEGMKVGGERVVTVPSKLGYGKEGSGDDIPPDSDLVFEVKVLKVG